MVCSDDGLGVKGNEGIKSSRNQATRTNRRHGRRASVVHLGGINRQVNDHHRVHELYAQLRDMVHRKQKVKKPHDSENGSESESDLSSDSDDEAMADREITLKYKDANELLNEHIPK